MPLPTTPPLASADAYLQTTVAAKSILLGAQAMRGALGAPVRVPELVSLFDVIRNNLATIARAIAVDGIEPYAANIFGSAYSIKQSAATVTTAASAVTNWILTALPVDANGGVVTCRIGADGQSAATTLSVDEIAPLAPLLETLISAIG